MKQFCMVMLVSLLAVGCQEVPKRCVVNGEVEDMPDGKIYLRSFRNKMFFDVDMAEVKGGKLTFKGEVDQPLFFGLATGSMNYSVRLFLENTDMNTEIGNGGETVTVQNLPMNDISQENVGKVFERGYSIDSSISKYPDSPAAASYLYRYFIYQLSLDDLKATRMKISLALTNSPYTKDLDGIIRQLEHVQIGQITPEFSLPGAVGASVSSSDSRGRYVLLDFWTSWYPPCRKENPSMVNAFQQYKGKNFMIIGISLDKDEAEWQRAVADDHLTRTHVSDSKYRDSEIPALYGVRDILTNMLLGPSGMIIVENITGKNLQNISREVIK